MASKVLLWMFRGCGVAPSGGKSDKYFTALFMMTLSLTTVSLVLREHDIPNWLNKILFLVGISLNLVAVLCITTVNIFYPQGYMSIGRNLEAIDNQLHDVGITGYRLILKEKFVLLYYLFGSILGFGVLIGKGVFQSSLIVVESLLINAALCQEIVFASLIHSRFSAINNHLVHIAVNPNTGDRSQLDQVFRLHANLQALVVDVDEHYCIYNLFRFTAKFLHSVFTMYEYLMFISHDRAYIMYYRLFWFAIQSLYFICQAVVCHACSKEANHTVPLVHRVLKPYTPFNLWEEVGLFSTLATDNKVYFTIGGIFILDRALITNTALTALAYLIIAVQLRDITLFQGVTPNNTTVGIENATM